MKALIVVSLLLLACGDYPQPEPLPITGMII